MKTKVVPWVAAAIIPIAAACFSEKSDDVTGPAPNYVSCSSSAPAPPSNARVVRIRNFAFDPAQVTVSAGTTVWWINCENAGVEAHTTTSDTGVWSSTLLQPAATYSRQFGSAGGFAYHCAPHPNMIGTITVS